MAALYVDSEQERLQNKLNECLKELKLLEIMQIFIEYLDGIRGVYSSLTNRQCRKTAFSH